jgi:hypothetical protein
VKVNDEEEKDDVFVAVKVVVPSVFLSVRVE